VLSSFPLTPFDEAQDMLRYTALRAALRLRPELVEGANGKRIEACPELAEGHS
jgi:hypothetical protein